MIALIDRANTFPANVVDNFDTPFPPHDSNNA
jgi:hypothetical protein